MVASRRTLRAVLALSSTRELAHVLGVSERVVRSWLKKGIPAEQAEKISTAHRAAKARLAEEKKALKGSAEALAEVYGVTVRTAKSWKKKGAVSKRLRPVIPLLESETREPAPRKFKMHAREWTKGRTTSRGLAATIDVNAYLDPALARDLIRWAYLVRDPYHGRNEKRFNLALEGNAPEDFAEAAAESAAAGGTRFLPYNTKQLRTDSGDEFEHLVLATRSRANRSEAISEMKDQLEEADGLGLYIESLTLFIKVVK